MGERVMLGRQGVEYDGHLYVRVRVRVRVRACVFACAQVPRIPSPILGTTTSPFFRRNCLSFLSGHVTGAATHKAPSS